MEADQVHASLRVYVSVERTTDVGERKQVVTDPCHGYSILPVPNDVQYCTNARTARTLLWNYMRGSENWNYMRGFDKSSSRAA